jgi:hypothetical protein
MYRRWNLIITVQQLAGLQKKSDLSLSELTTRMQLYLDIYSLLLLVLKSSDNILLHHATSSIHLDLVLRFVSTSPYIHQSEILPYVLEFSTYNFRRYYTTHPDGLSR